ncbi:MAG: PIN domain-containing protein [Actinomycetales bacterium]|nr:PIN domain-containing protein [Actinomycetales bacterium]
MLCLDVNVLIDLLQPRAERHAVVRAWLQDRVQAKERVLILPDVAASFIRIASSARLWQTPPSTTSAARAIRELCSTPMFSMAGATPRRLTIFFALLDRYSLTSMDVTDAFIVAGAVDLGAVLVSSDAGISRFTELEVVHPT